VAEVRFEKVGNVGILTIDNEEQLNALSFETFAALNKALDLVEAEQDLFCLILTGSGDKAFAAGADISALAKFSVLEGHEWSRLGNDTYGRIERLPIPVIAAVNGYALGGGTELILACDIAIASEGAIFGQPEVNLGLIPGWGGTQRLPRLIGKRRAKELIYTGRMIKAEEAYQYGLVNKVVPPDKLMEEALTMANLIASKAPIAIRYSKLAIDQGLEGSLETGIGLEKALFAECFSTKDYKLGVTAFLEKKKEVKFTNK
jgi:enoyl-CoA hydratase